MKIFFLVFFYNCGACVVQRLCNGLPCDGPGFDSLLSLNDHAVDGTLNTNNQPSSITMHPPPLCFMHNPSS